MDMETQKQLAKDMIILSFSTFFHVKAPYKTSTKRCEWPFKFRFFNTSEVLVDIFVSFRWVFSHIFF